MIRMPAKSNSAKRETSIRVSAQAHQLLEEAHIAFGASKAYITDRVLIEAIKAMMAQEIPVSLPVIDGYRRQQALPIASDDLEKRLRAIELKLADG